MIRIPVAKAHAAGNDFLIVEGSPETLLPDPRQRQRICDRHYGIGADGLVYVGLSCAMPSPEPEVDANLRIFNRDGGEAEISGNGTRCVAAYLTAAKRVAEKFSISTDAGNKQLELLNAAHPNYVFKMAMGLPSYQTADIDTKLDIAGSPSTVTLVNVGNPQCAMFADDFEFDWRKLGAAIEQHPHFPDRTNVSFIRVIDCHTIDVRFWERGAGETMSSGTGSTGAAAAAIISKRAESPITVKTVAGDMTLDWTDQIYLTGGAQIIATGYYNHTVGL